MDPGDGPRSAAGSAVDVWLVRHGQTEWSEAGRYAGWTDLSLTASGEAHARDLRTVLPSGDDVSAWSSDLTRCIRTATLAGYRPQIDQRLRELDFGTIEGQTWDELSAGDQAALIDFEGFAAPAGESVSQLRERVHEFLDELKPGRHVVVTHGGVVRLLLREAGRDGSVAPAQVEQLRWPLPG